MNWPQCANLVSYTLRLLEAMAGYLDIGTFGGTMVE